MSDTLLIGYGNLDREDDGVAWHILALLTQKLGRPTPSSPDESFENDGRDPDLLFVLQLTPELSETISAYKRVCFIDTHTGRVPGELQFVEVDSRFQQSPFTHHMTPETCLALSETLYGHRPDAYLVSVRGYEFGFSRSLSPRTAELAMEAAKKIRDWL